MSDWKHFFCNVFQNLNFFGDLVYKFRKIIGKYDFPYHFKKIIVRYKKIGYTYMFWNTRHAWLLIQSRLTTLLTSFIAGGGRVVWWWWVNFQSRGVLLVWKIVGQGPTVLAVGAGGGGLHIFSLISLFCLPLSGRRPDIDWNTVSKGR